MYLENIMYRSEDSYGSGVRDIIQIMVYEIYELGNTDILEYISEHYLDAEDKKVVAQLIMMIESGDELSEDDIENLCEELVDKINKKTNHNLKYALWLADKNVVEDMYAYDTLNIDAYNTSDVILSDLGYDGILFAYDEEPQPIKNINENKLLEYSLDELKNIPLPPETTKTDFDGFDINGAGNNPNSLESELLPTNPNRKYQIDKGRYPSEVAGGNDEDWWHYSNPYIAEITPQEYFDLCYTYIFHRTAPNIKDAINLPEIIKENVLEYSELMKNGTKFLMPYINFRTEQQEGRHRAIAAYLAGIETIPCEIII